SFGVWKETVRYTSAPWSHEELGIAERFRNIVVEHTLQSLANSLEKKVLERTEALAASKSELEKTFNELMQITYVASHDLREPARKIQVFGNKLKAAMKESEGRQSLDRILLASQRITGLLGDLVNYSRLSHPAASSRTDLNQIVKEVIEDFDLTISDRSVSLDISDLPVVNAVPDEMRQVFYSLFSNALKFSRPEIPPKISIKCTVENESEKAAQYRIDFTDNGIGFDQEYSERVFEMFRTLHPPDKYEGRGIGLAITRKIIEKINGTITAKSSRGEGTTFSIRLPKANL